MADELILDLDADRDRRAAEREGKNQGLPIRLGGKIISTLPPEFPLDVIEPLRQVDQDLALLLSQAIRMSQGGADIGEGINNTALVIDLLVSNPKLPSTFIEVLKECGNRLFGEEGMDALAAARLSAPDVGFLVKQVAGYYGFGLGEASESSDSQVNGGATSNAISSGTTDSTPEESTKTRKKKAS